MSAGLPTPRVMATHDYKCSACGAEDERFTSMAKVDEPQTCGECLGEMTRVYRKFPALTFNGAMYKNSRMSFHEHSVSHIRNRVESSEEFKSGKLRRKEVARWV